MLWRHVLFYWVVIGIQTLGAVSSKRVTRKKAAKFSGNELSCPDADSKWITHVEVPWGIRYRAHRTIPPELYVAQSSIPGAGQGVFSNTFISKYTWLGWYEGEVLTDLRKSDYIFTITRSEKPYHYIDPEDTDLSNWTRWMNMPTCVQQENVNVVQCKGRTLFITNRDIHPGQELMYYYGHPYAMALGVFYNLKGDLAPLAEIGNLGLKMDIGF